ncbi:bone morphogenetic protein 7-like [Montipora capricornis]|uniref:bone morphogenetic protein 7-like n=1 Tax=Montipora capricornis TaxID=246305 RepID=UPI0035F11B65
MTCLARLLVSSLLTLRAVYNAECSPQSSSNKLETASDMLGGEFFRNLPLPRRHRRDRRVPRPSKDQSNDGERSSAKNGTTSIKLQREILNLLGLARRPRLSLHTRLHGRKMSAPRYMMDLYNSLELNVSATDAGVCCNTSGTDSRAVGADTIMSYLNHVRGARPKISRRHATFRFKMESPIGEKITAAEFRIYKEQLSRRNAISWENSTYQIKLFQVVQPARMLKLLHTRVLRSWDSGWEAFDISLAGQEWAQEPTKNFGIEVSVRTLAGEELDPYDVGFVGFHGPQEKRPFLVSFFRGEQDVTYRRFFPQGPAVANERRSRRSPRAIGGQLDSTGGADQQSNSKSCGRRMLYVSFERLGWQDWIIAPEGYSAFFCHGQCSFPLSAHMNATNHAIVQTLVHLMNPTVVPQPCCSPTKLAAISVLYFDDSNNVVLKKYTNMVVKACGCH